MDDIELDQFAWQLVSGKQTPIDEPPILIDEASLEGRALNHVYRTAIQPFLLDPNALFQAMQHIWLEARLCRNDNFHGQALARAHNVDQTNGVTLAIAAIEGDGDVFTIIRMLADALPLFERIEVSDLVRFFEACHPRIRNDLANGLPYNAAEHWLTIHPERVDEIVASCLATPSAAVSVLLRIALVRSVAIQPEVGLARIHDLRSSENRFVALPAIEALGLVDWTTLDRPKIDQAVMALRNGLASPDDDTVISSSLAALWLIKSSPNDHVLIDEIAALEKPFVVKLIGDHLAYRADPCAWFPEKIMLLAGKTGQNPGSYDGVDHVLSSLYQDATSPWDPTPWLDVWVQSHTREVDDEGSFPNLFRQLFAALSRNPGSLEKLLTRWILQSDLGVQRIARGILDELGHTNYTGLRVPRDMLDQMSGHELMHLVRRLLGNVFRDEQLVFLIWSMTDTQSAETRTFKLVSEVFVNHVGYSYPHAAETHLKRVADTEGDTPIGHLANAIIQRINCYYDDLNALPRLEELKSPDEHRHRYLKAGQRAMNRAYEKANKNSIIELIATKIPLKAGRSSFSRRQGHIGEKMHLSSFSHSIAFPRAESIDSIGSAIERFHFQIAKVGDA